MVIKRLDLKMGKFKICLVGGEDVRMRLPLILKLRAMGHDVFVVGSEPPEIFKSQGIAYFRYQLSRSFSIYSDLRSVCQITKIFSGIKPDVIHCFDTKPSILGIMAAKLSGIRGSVRTICGMGYLFSEDTLKTRALRPVYHIVQRIASRLSTRTIFQNRDDFDYFLKNRLVQSESAVLVRSSGIDVASILLKKPTTEDRDAMLSALGLQGFTVVIMVARLLKNKGVLEFLGSARALQRRHVKFLLVGPLASEGDQAVDVDIIEQYRDYVEYLGVSNDVFALLACSDVFVLPSYYREGVPRVLLEAGVMGLPIITTDMPGCRDVVEHGVNGLLVKPRSEESLTSALQILLENPRYRANLASSGLECIKRSFDLNDVVKSYCNIYCQIME